MVCLPSAWLPKNPYSLSQVPVARLNVGLGGVNPNTLDAFNGYWGVKMNFAADMAGQADIGIGRCLV